MVVERELFIRNNSLVPKNIDGFELKAECYVLNATKMSQHSKNKELEFFLKLNRG